MKFVCDRCQTKYSIADEKVRGKLLRVRCKTCANVITVREPASASGSMPRPSSPSLAPVRSSRPSAAMRAVGGGGSVPHPVTGPESSRQNITEVEDERSEHTQIAAPSAAFMADMARPRRSPTRPPASPPPSPEVQWYVAIDGEQQGPFARPGLIDKLLALPKDADVHVWNEKLDGWKPPRDIPEVARDLQARRRPSIPPSMPPRPPSPPRGAPVHSTHPPAGGLRARLAASAGSAGSAPAAAPVAASAVLGPPASGVRLPAPSGSSPSFGVRAAAGAAAAPVAAPSAGEDIDPGSMLDTPAPKPHPVPAAKGSNGVGAHGAAASGPAATPAALAGGETSDALSALNLAAATATPAAPADGPRLLRHSQVVQAWSGTAAVKEAGAARHRNAKLLFACLGVVAVIVTVVALNATRKSSSQPVPTPPPARADNPLKTLQDQIAKESEQEKAAPGETPAEPSKVKVVGGAKGRLAAGRPNPALHAAAAGARGPAPAGNPADEAAAARFRSDGERTVQVASPSNTRPALSPEAIMKVVKNNRAGITTCYQRALLRDSSLTHGKLTVHLTIGISGRVMNVAVNGPPQFHVLDPCIKDVVGRWVFPASSESSEFEFPFLFQGNE